jgi:hypothetical protein
MHNHHTNTIICYLVPPSRHNNACTNAKLHQHNACTNVKLQQHNACTNAKLHQHNACTNVKSHQHNACTNAKSHQHNACTNVKSQQHNACTNVKLHQHNAVIAGDSSGEAMCDAHLKILPEAARVTLTSLNAKDRAFQGNDTTEKHHNNVPQS